LKTLTQHRVLILEMAIILIHTR